jgi:bifunctional non-homologous end joining protein LigD
MKATSGTLPTGSGWVYELKWDGMRVLAEVGPEGVRAWSSNGKDATASFPELAALGPALAPVECVLDGEVVALDAAGRPSFTRLQNRMHVSSPADARRRAQDVPVEYVVFDVLSLGGHDTTGLPWADRHRLLESLAEDFPPGVDAAQAFEDGEALLAACRAQGLEGVIAKRADSTYLPGTRTRSWVKVKVRRRQEVVVGGWAPGEGNRAGGLGSLLIGVHDTPGAPDLRYGGRVGSGFTGAELLRMERVLRPLAVDACPFSPPPPALYVRGSHWVRPEVVVEVAYGEWTDDGRLRHPVYLGQRDDVDPAAVIREPVA